MITTTMLHLLVAFDRMLQRAKDEDGQTLAEYGLIMSVIAVAVVVSAGIAFRGAIVAAFDSASACLSGTCS
jgi:Flp pilus assembly pilin Flp